MVAEDDGHRIKMPTAMVAVADKARPPTNQDLHLPITIVAAGLVLNPRLIPERVSITAEGIMVITRRSIPARRRMTSWPPYLCLPPLPRRPHLLPDTQHRPPLPMEELGPSHPSRRYLRLSRRSAVARVLMTGSWRLCLPVFVWI